MNHQCRAFSYYCDERVCLYVCMCVCLSAIICSQLHVRSSPIFFMYVTYCRGSVLLWRHNDTLCTSGFMDDVIFAHKPMLLDIAAHRTHGTSFRALKVTSHVATPGAESAVYDCVVLARD